MALERKVRGQLHQSVNGAEFRAILTDKSPERSKSLVVGIPTWKTHNLFFHGFQTPVINAVAKSTLNMIYKEWPIRDD